MPCSASRGTGNVGAWRGVLSSIAKFTAPNVAGKLVCAGTAPAARLRVQPVVPRPRIVGRVAAGAHLRARRARSHVLVVGLRFLRTEPHEVTSRRLHGMSNRLKNICVLKRSPRAPLLPAAFAVTSRLAGHQHERKPCLVQC